MPNRVLFSGTYASSQPVFRVRMVAPDGYRMLSSGFEVPSNTTATVVESRPGPKGTMGESSDNDSWAWTVRNPDEQEVVLTGWLFCEAGASTFTLEIDGQEMQDEF